MLKSIKLLELMMFQRAQSPAANEDDKTKELGRGHHRRNQSVPIAAIDTERADSRQITSLKSPPRKSDEEKDKATTTKRVSSLGGSAVFDSLIPKKIQSAFSSNVPESPQSATANQSLPQSIQDGANSPSKLRSVTQLVKSQVAISHLMEFMAEHQCDDYLRFWLAMEDYKNVDLRNSSSEALTKDAHAIYQRFFGESKNKFFQSNDAMITKLRETFQTETRGEVLFESLFFIQKEVLTMIDRTFLQPFRESVSYKRMVREIQQARTERASPRPTIASEQAVSSPTVSDLPNSPQKRALHLHSARSLSLSSLPVNPSVSSAPAPTLPPRPSYQQQQQQQQITPLPTSLRDILTNPIMLFYLMEFMERHKSKNLVNFWLTVESYSSASMGTKDGNDSEEDDDKLLYKDAQTLFNLYFSPDAPQPIKISRTLYTQLQGYVQRKPVGGQLFRFEVIIRIQKEVYQQMERRFFRSFLESSLFADCKRELLFNGVPLTDAAEANGTSSLQPASSSSASTNGINGTSTMSAGAIEALSKRPAMQGSLLSNLRIGYLDELGFFVNDTDPEPHDLYAVEIAEPSKSAFSSLLGGSANVEEDPVAVRMQAKAILAEVAQSTNSDVLKYDEADSL